MARGVAFRGAREAKERRIGELTNMADKTEENIEKLAKESVSQLDMDGLIDFAEGQMEAYYETISTEDFNTEWVQVFGEE